MIANPSFGVAQAGRCVSKKSSSRITNAENRVTPTSITTEASGADGIDEVFRQLYASLKVIARRELRRSSSNTLSTTALVHELYLKMSRASELRFEDSLKFFAYAAMGIRHILLDRAKRHCSVKAGGKDVRVELDSSAVENVSIDAHLALRLDAALRELAQADARAARVVELHYFAGLPLEKVGELLGIAPRTVDRDWRYARAFLESGMD